MITTACKLPVLSWVLIAVASFLAARAYSETLQVFASDCATPQSDFNLGGTVCVKVSGAPLGAASPQRQFQLVNPCGFVEHAGPAITTDPQTTTYTLPVTDTTAVGACDARGKWIVADYNVTDDGQQLVTYFYLHDTANPVADLSVQKFVQGGGGLVNPGTNVTYKLLVRNLGPDTASNVSLTDVVPTNMTFVSEAHPAGWNCTDPASGGTGTITCTTPSLAADSVNGGTPATFTLVFKLNAATANGTQISNTATISASTTDPHNANNSATDSTVIAQVTQAGPLIVLQSLIVYPGNLQNWQLQTTHGGQPSPAATPSVTFVTGPGTPPLNAGSAQLKVGSDGSAAAALRLPDYAGATLPVSSGKPVSTTLTALSYYTYIQTGGTGSQAPYLVLDVDYNNDGTADDQLIFEPQYQGSGTCPGNPQAAVTAGQWQSWDAAHGCWYSKNGVAGTSPGTVTFLFNITAAQPNAKIVNASGGNGGVHVAAGFAGGPIGGVATDWNNFLGNVDVFKIGVYTSSDAGSYATTYDFETQAPPSTSTNFTVTNSPSSSQALQDTDITYTIGVANAGANAAPNAILTDVLPAGSAPGSDMTFVSLASPAGWSCEIPAVGANGILTCTETSLAAGSGLQSFTLVGHIPPGTAAGAVYNNSVSVSADNAANNTATATTTVITTLVTWRNLQSLPADGSQDLANPSHDGVVNLLKYAFNMAPNPGDLLVPNAKIMIDGGTAGLPLITRNAQGKLTIEFVRRKASTNPGITYTVETGSNLAGLNPLDLSGATVTSIDNTWERVTVTDPTTDVKRFGHVRITESP